MLDQTCLSLKGLELIIEIIEKFRMSYSLLPVLCHSPTVL